jgi:TatA/E family protein of Tat protein translocase
MEVVAMFGIGMPEFLLILVVALVVFGPKKLPELARTIGRTLAEFKKSADELKENLNVGEEFKDIQKDFKELVDPSKILYPSDVTPPHSEVTPPHGDNNPEKIVTDSFPKTPTDAPPKAPDA